MTKRTNTSLKFSQMINGLRLADSLQMVNGIREDLMKEILT